MLKHMYESPVKRRSKSQSSEISANDDIGLLVAITRNWHHNQSDDDDDADDDHYTTRGGCTSSSAGKLSGTGCIKLSGTTCGKPKTKISRRRPPSGADSAVRRWNSFHSTRNECHPNKFRRERKSTAPNIEYGRSRSSVSSPARGYEARRVKSLAATDRTSNDFAQALLAAAAATAASSAATSTRRAHHASITPPSTRTDYKDSLNCFGKRNGGSVRRPSECFVIESSEMIVVDYPDGQQQPQHQANPGSQQQQQQQSSGGHQSPAIPNIYHRTPSLPVTSTATITNPPFTGYHSVSNNNNNATLSLAPTIGAIGQHPQQHQYHQVASATTTPTGNFRGVLPFRQSVGNSCSGISPNDSRSMDHHHNANSNSLRHTSASGGFDDASFGNARPELYQKCNRGSHSSDTSSAYSGSDTMTSVHSSSLDVDEVDLSGLVESVVDSDEEDLAESMDSLAVRDTVRECLEKDPSDRTEDDIETLLDFTKNLKAFTNMTLAVRRALCSVMVFAVVEKAGTMVMNNGEELDSWSVLINGHVEIDHTTGEKEELQVGDSFGILPTMVKLYHRGVMRTKCHDCQFVCITQTDYYRIHHQGEENTMKHEEDGQLVMVTELRHGGVEAGARRGHVVIRGTSERLMLQLIEENSMTDPTYVEDFLLTHRTFIRSAHDVSAQLLAWFENENIDPATTTATPSEIRDRVTRVVLLWVNNHFTDFETDPAMMEFLETFEAGLEKKFMQNHLRLLHIACASKARQRTVTLARSSRDEPLQFAIVGGYEKGYGYGIFIAKVDKRSKPEDKGLKRGDQILEVNGHSFEHVSNARAVELLMGTTHLSITVKSNLLAFKEMLHSSDSTSPRSRQAGRRKAMSDIAKLQIGGNDPRARLSSVDMLSQDQTDCLMWAGGGGGGGGGTPAKHCTPVTGSAKKDGVVAPTSKTGTGGFMTLGPKRRLQKALIKMNLLPKNAVTLLMDGLIASDDSASGAQQSAMLSAASTQSTTGINSAGSDGAGSIGGGSLCSNSTNSSTSLYQSHSNPDLTTVYYEDPRSSDYPEHVLKVYKPDQTCKYLLVHKETTAHEVVMLALQEFGIHETSSNFSLCEVSVAAEGGGMIKQRRLPEQLQNLAERIGLAARYYLKTNGITETLVPDEMAADLVRESAVHFLQLNANELAIQLTFQDFAIFRQIESTEYVDDLFELKSRYGVPMLRQFAELVNREMFWVVSEVCSEHNMVRRMKIIKQFVKIARHCKECKNFNSMFAIVSGLGHVAVSRLRQTWEKLPTKYQKLFCDLQDLMDPSRNMSKYRQLVLAELLAKHPIIPFYPVVKKDLTFIHLGNDTRVDNLINFEKLRMIAKEVRSLTHMCCSPYDLLTMLEQKGQPPSSAMVALNQMTAAGTGQAGVTSSNTIHLPGQTTVKRRKKSTAAPNPKKMFEEAQMVRRVKAYLNNMRVITDEDALHVLSLECEPSCGTGGGGGGGGGGGSSSGSAPNTVIIRKRHPSPTLSTTSSTSSASEGKKGAIHAAAVTSAAAAAAAGGPKFGTASPHAVKKILSLSEQNKTRPHQPRHPGMPVGGATGALGPPGHHHHHHGLHHLLAHHAVTVTGSSSGSPVPSPGAHRRMGSSSSAGSVSYSTHEFPANSSIGSGGRAVHERSHSDTPTPLPSVDLSVESSSVTSLSNLPLRKNIASGSVTSSDSGHGSCVQTDTHSNCSENGSGANNVGGLYHVASSIVHNSPSPTLQQRRHSNIHAHGLMGPPPSMKAPRHPPAYSVAAQMARLHRLGRAHSHEGVTSAASVDTFYMENGEEEDDDEDAQVSAV